MTPLTLGVLALLLSGPAPSVLTRLPRIRLVPRAAMVLWQALALAAVLAALGAGLSLTTDRALRDEPSLAGWLVAGFALLVTAVVLVRLLWKGHRVGTGMRALRRRHRDLVDVLGAADARGGVHVLEHESPMAYCVPGWRSQVVVSQGTLATLEHDEVDGVLAHERAHLRARHDLVLEAFTVLREAFPRWVSSAAALTEVRLLVEVLADRAARRRVGAGPVARALVTLADSRTPEAALGAGGSGLVERVELLRDDGHHPLLAAATYVAAIIVLVVPTVFVALPWLASVASRL